MDIQLVALDLDGTLLRSDNSISERTIGALRRCRERGVKIALVTARSYQSTERINNMVSADLLVLNGGAEIRKDRETLFNLAMSNALADEVVAFASTLPSFYRVTADTSDGRYLVSSLSENNLSGDYLKAELFDFNNPIDSCVLKLVIHLRDEADRRALTGQYKELAIFTYVGTNATFVAQKGALKWNGLCLAAEMLGVSPDNTAVFGDDFHDKEMIERCGVGIAMGNAVAEVKESADYITDSTDDDGVATWLETHLLPF